MNDNKEKKNKKNIKYCNNCGKYGHFFSNCKNPITSFGIIMFKIPPSLNINKIKYLQIRRRNSMSFVEFIRGKYKYCDTDFLYNLFNRMAIFEKDILKNQSFDKIWDNLWINSKFKKENNNEYNKVKNKFELLKNGLTVNNNFFISIQSLIENSNKKYEECEWNFPKGRRNFYENDIDCAIREFLEETNFDINDYKLLHNLNCYRQDHIGTNLVSYRTVYYIAKYINTNNKIPHIDPNNKNQLGEIGKIEWLNYDNIIKNFRDYEYEKKKTIYEVHKKICKYINENIIKLNKN